MDDDFKIEICVNGEWREVASVDVYMLALRAAKAESFGKLARIVRRDLGKVIIVLKDGMGTGGV